MSFSNDLEIKVLDHIFNKTTYTPATNIHVALSTADPLDDGTGLAEPVGNAYARVSTVPADWNAAAAGSLSNANTIPFPKATGPWGLITHFAIFDAVAGNLMGSGLLTPSKDIGVDDTPSFAAGSLTVTLD